MSSVAKLLASGSEIELINYAGTWFLVWLVGLVLGWLLPRPKWMRRVFNSKNAFMLTPSGLWLGRAAVAWNGLLIIREIWYKFCFPGTFRGILKQIWISFKTGLPFQWPSLPQYNNANETLSNPNVLKDPLNWYVTVSDLETYKDAIERNVGAPWEKMLQKDWEGCAYTAWRRSLPNGKTEYKSVTISENATAQEFMDFYLDDDTRPKWDGMINEHYLLEDTYDPSHRCQVVRWVRTFPFAFISSREYVIARRVFVEKQEAGEAGNSIPSTTLYAITRGIEHPAAPPQPGVVRMSSYYSMWRSRTIPCPKGSGRPACETTLLHFEDFGIPENLARFAVRHGMAGFVGKMVPVVQSFVEERRARCDPFTVDARAYGAEITPLLHRSDAAHTMSKKISSQSRNSPHKSSSSSSLVSESISNFDGDSASDDSGHHIRRSPSLRGLGYMLLASGVAIAIGRTSSSGALTTTIDGSTHSKSHNSNNNNNKDDDNDDINGDAKSGRHSYHLGGIREKHIQTHNHHHTQKKFGMQRMHSVHGIIKRHGHVMSNNSNSNGLHSHRLMHGDATRLDQVHDEI